MAVPRFTFTTPYLQASYLCNRGNNRNEHHLPSAQTLKEPDQGYLRGTSLDRVP
jgi:hypothetical protein